MVRVFTKSTVWPSPAGISSSSSAQPAAALPLDYWCSVLSVQSLLSEGLGEDIGYVFVMRILIEIYNPTGSTLPNILYKFFIAVHTPERLRLLSVFKSLSHSLIKACGNLFSLYKFEY